MTEITYRPEIRCELSEGLTESDVTVCIKDVDGVEQYIHVVPSMINRDGDTEYLPIGVINVDRLRRQVLIELPIEADSGVNRMWVPFDAFRTEALVPA